TLRASKWHLEIFFSNSNVSFKTFYSSSNCLFISSNSFFFFSKLVVNDYKLLTSSLDFTHQNIAL
ncbi:16783_t:CDS:1, partial [Funneliformis caledonium]